jgi:predicted dehydrogenase
MPLLKAAIIGGGHIADQNHIPALQQLSDQVEIVAICSRVKEKARALADKHGIPNAFDNTNEMYSSADKPDLIVNCTANNLHHPFNVEALENGCHVLCEKPPGMNGAEARQVADLAKQKGKVLAYNFQLRQTDEYALIRRLQQNGDLGTVYHIKASYLRRRGIPGWGNFTNKSVQGGGALIDLGVHILDLALGLLDYQMPDQIIANTYDYIGKAGGKGLMGTWNANSFEVEDSCFAHLSFPGNASITLSASFALNTQKQKDVNLEVFGSNGGALLNPPTLYTEIGGELADVAFPFTEHADIQLRNTSAFINACLGLTSNICSAYEGAIIQEIVERIYQSADAVK